MARLLSSYFFKAMIHAPRESVRRTFKQPALDDAREVGYLGTVEHNPEALIAGGGRYEAG